MDKPIIALTMGDPAGIGPELVVKALSCESIWQVCRPVVVGDPSVFEQTIRQLGARLRISVVRELSTVKFTWPQIDILAPSGLQVNHFSPGILNPAAGKAAGLSLRQATELAMAGLVQGVVSAPLNKEAFHLAGFHYRDELEYLADLTTSRSTSIIGVIPGVWTITVTEHIPFKEIVAAVKKANILEQVMQLNEMLASSLGRTPRIAVAALNPHGGEGGLLGSEEIEEIRPAVEEACAQGIKVSGPVPADIVFVMALQGLYDGVVCMYHDQANIARKLQPIEQGATLFVGLPFPCATTAHGTAFDKAGQGIADPSSFKLALTLVCQLAGH